MKPGRRDESGHVAVWVALVLFASLFAASHVALDRLPVRLSVIRGGEVPQAFRLSLFLNHREPVVESLALTEEQKRDASRAIATQDVTGLRALSETLGGGGRYVAFTEAAGASSEWPAFLGGGWRALSSPRSTTWSSNLPWSERVVLALWTKTPPEAPSPGPMVLPLDLPASATPGTAMPQASGAATNPSGSQAAEPLRVEILNGCGITNAAEAVARAARQAGMTVVSTGNVTGPKRFKVPKTLLESRSGVPVALEDLCGRLGIPVSEIRTDVAAKNGVDVTLTLGRDYPKIRERLRGRNQR